MDGEREFFTSYTASESMWMAMMRTMNQRSPRNRIEILTIHIARTIC